MTVLSFSITLPWLGQPGAQHSQYWGQEGEEDRHAVLAHQKVLEGNSDETR